MSATLNQAELKAWRRFVSGMSAMTGALDRQLRDDSNLSLDDFGILSRLASSPSSSIRMTELADHLSYSPSRLSHAISRMAKLGWVERVSAAEDRRGVIAKLTPTGEQTLKAAWPEHATLVRELVIDQLSRDQLGQLEQIFTNIDRAAQKHDRNSSPPKP